MSNKRGKTTPGNKTALHFYSQDLQLQTQYSDGRCSIDDIVRASIEQGRTTIGITDHAIGWDDGDDHSRFFETAVEFKRYLAEIDMAKKLHKEQGITVLTGLEVEIGLDGHMALAPGILEVIGSEANILKYVDYVIGVIHSESFTVSLGSIAGKISAEEKSQLLLQNVEALINNPNVLIWGHPFQAVHGHFLRDFTAAERQTILDCLGRRTPKLLLEYNLNPEPRYEEWQAKSTHYLSGMLVPNDMAFFEACIDQLDSRFAISTDAHDVAQTSRLNSQTVVPGIITERLVFLNDAGEPIWN